MTATRFPDRRKTATKAATAPKRPVTEVLLELAYCLHATKVVARREVPAPNRDSGSR